MIGGKEMNEEMEQADYEAQCQAEAEAEGESMAQMNAEAENEVNIHNEEIRAKEEANETKLKTLKDLQEEWEPIFDHPRDHMPIETLRQELGIKRIKELHTNNKKLSKAIDKEIKELSGEPTYSFANGFTRIKDMGLLVTINLNQIILLKEIFNITEEELE